MTFELISILDEMSPCCSQTEADRLSSERTAWLRLKANEEASKAALAKESAVNAEKATTEGIVKQAAGEKETTVDDKGADGDEEKDQKEEKLQTTEDQKTTSVVGSSSSTPNNNHIQNLVPFTFKTPEELLAIGTLPAPTTTISEEPEAQSQSQTQQVQQQQPPQQSQPQSQPPQLTLQTHQDPSTSTAAPPETEDFMHFLKSAVGSPVGDQVAEGSETNGGMGMSGQQGVEGENLMAALEASVAASVSGVNHGLNTDQGNQSEQQQMTDGSTAEGNINNMSSEEIMRALEQWDSLGGNEAGGGGGEGMLGNNFDGEQNVDNNDMTALPDAQSLPTTTGQNQVVNESQADQDLFDLLASFPDAGGNVAADGGDPSTLNFGNGQDNNLNFDLPMDLGLPQDQSEQQMFNQTEGVLPPNNNNNQPEFDISQFSDLLSGFPELAMPDGSGNGGNGQVGEGAFEEFREGGVEGDAGGEDDIMKLLAGIGGDQ